MEKKSLSVIQMVPELESGGVEEDCLEMAEFLAKNGHRSIVVSGGGRMVKRLEKAGAIHVRMPVGEKNPSLLRTINPLRKLITGLDADILHLRSRVPAWAGFIAANSLPPRKRPGIITTFHGTYSVHFFSSIMTRGQRVVAISRFIQNHIRDNYSRQGKQVALIHGGYDSKRFNPERVDKERVNALKEKWGIDRNNCPVIMLPARMTGWKGHRLFLDALALIREIDFKALLVGGLEENPDYVQELISKIENLGLDDRVIFTGQCDDMPAAFLCADLVVSASTEPEAFGRVAVEAMAMERPVVATAHGGSLETILDNETGWLVRPNSAPAMAKAILKAVSDPGQLLIMGRKAGIRMKEEFSTRKMCQKTLELYYEVIAENRQKPPRFIF